MADTHTIEAVQPGRTYSDKYGDKQVWMVGLTEARAESPSGLFELHKKTTSKPPEQGQQIEVERFIQGEHNGEVFVRIKQVYSQGQQSGGGSGGDGGKFDRRPEHPRNESRMIHTSAMSAAPTYIEQMLTIGVAEQPKDEYAYWKLVSAVVGRLARSYDRAMDDQQSLPVNGQGEAPVDTEGLAPTPAASQADQDIPF